MAQRAGLEESLLAVKRRSPGRAAGFCIGSDIGVALQTEQIDVAHPQHVRIRATMGNMAGRTAFDLYRLMLEDERSLFVGMAGKADGILRRRSSHLPRANRAVWIVAIRTLHQSLIHAMAKWHLELRFLLQMAGVTKLGLRLHQQELFGLRMVRRMTGNATDIVLGVNGVNGVHVLRAAFVAGHATSIDVLGRSVFEHKDFGFIAATSHVISARAVTTFAALLRWAALFI